MFTGLVEETGALLTLARSASGARLTLRAPLVAADARLGDSIAVNGCCLTVTARDGDVLAFDLLAETLDRTNLGALALGAPVNLERALAGQRLALHDAARLGAWLCGRAAELAVFGGAESEESLSARHVIARLGDACKNLRAGCW